MSDRNIPNEQMTPEALAALRGSVAKWEAIVAGTRENGTASDCPLCQIFNPHQNRSAQPGCRGCPVRQKTGAPFCKGSPYDEYEHLEDEYGGDPDEDQAAYLKGLARQELEFLKSLLPEAPVTALRVAEDSK